MRLPKLVSRSLLFGFLLTTCSFASAEVVPPYLFDGRVIGSVEAVGLRLQIQLDGNAWSVNQWLATPAAIDVYRKTVGADCTGSWVRMTDEPIAWNWTENPGGGPHMAFELVDDTAESGHAYMYYARAVDANRDPIAANQDAYLGVATHGVALLAHGTIYGGAGGCGQSYRQEVLDSCDSECYPWLLVNTSPEVEPYINSGIRLLLYGTIVDVTAAFCGTNETIAFISSAVPSECVVPTEETTWGNVKQLYR